MIDSLHFVGEKKGVKVQLGAQRQQTHIRLSEI
jgi:hypothetical protein